MPLTKPGLPSPGPPTDRHYRLCITLAVISGSLRTVAAIAIQFPSHRHAVRGTTQGKCAKICTYVLNFILTSISTTVAWLAVLYGPVSIAMPFEIASSLVSTMVFSLCLGLTTYTKDMYVGTLVLSSAVMILANIGPADVSDVNPIDRLMNPVSVMYILVSFLIMCISLCAICYKWVKENTKLLFVYAFMGGSGTVVNVSISKFLMMSGIFSGSLAAGYSIWVMVSFVVAYAIISLICVGGAALANSLDDPWLFMPISNGVNLVLNCLAGLCLWGDADRLPFPLSYAMVYCLVVLGTYLVSAFDFFSRAPLNPSVRAARFMLKEHGLIPERGQVKRLSRALSWPTEIHTEGTLSPGFSSWLKRSSVRDVEMTDQSAKRRGRGSSVHVIDEFGMLDDCEMTAREHLLAKLRQYEDLGDIATIRQWKSDSEQLMHLQAARDCIKEETDAVHTEQNQ